MSSHLIAMLSLASSCWHRGKGCEQNTIEVRLGQELTSLAAPRTTLSRASQSMRPFCYLPTSDSQPDCLHRQTQWNHASHVRVQRQAGSTCGGGHHGTCGQDLLLGRVLGHSCPDSGIHSSQLKLLVLCRRRCCARGVLLLARR